MESVLDARELLHVDGVAREVDGVGLPVGLAKLGPGQHEAHALPAGQVLAGSGRHFEAHAADAGGCRLPRGHAADAGTGRELAGAVAGGEDAAAVEKPAPELVQVVWVVLVAQEHGVDDREVRQAEGRPGCDFQHDDALVPLCPGGREEGVGDEVDSVDFENRGGGADKGDV